MEIRKVNVNEINRVMDIINDAIRLLGKNSLQWQQGYPNINTMSNDINNGDLFGVYDNDLLIGVVALVKGTDRNYTEIYEGSWDIPANDNDLIIHRIAVKDEYYHKGIGDLMMKYSIKYAKELNCVSIKADTHTLNKPMQYLLTSNNFKYKGIIYLKRDEEDNSRIAFELVL